MAVPTLYAFPASITAGDTTVIQLSFGDYPAAVGWAAAMILNQIGSAAVSITGSASADSFIFTIPAATSAAFSVGPITWAARVTLAGQVATAQAGDSTILANYATVVAASVAQLQLDAANTAMLALVANTQSSVSFNGQSFSQANSSQLLDIIMRLKAIVAAEQAQEAGLRGDAPTRSIRPFFVA